MIPKDFSWINAFFKCYFSCLPLWVCYRLKIQTCMSVQAGHMQSPENLWIIKWCYFKILYILLRLLRKVRWRKSHPESSALLLSVIVLHGLGNILITRKAPGFLPRMAHGFHHTDLGALRIRRWQRLPGSRETSLWQRSSNERCFLCPNKALSLWTQKYPLNILRKCSCWAAI